jgi:hypothetical protein
MNTIREYVESMFISVPVTEETEQLKTDILANMEDKYEELRQGGATENEAIGAVITEFGNIDEVLEEMDIKKEVNFDDLDDVMVVEEEDAYEYIEAKRRAGTGIGLGLISILTGLGGFLISYGLGRMSDTSLALGLIFFLLCTAVGVGLFILHGMRLSEYSDYSESFYVLMPSVRKEIEDMRTAYKRSHAFSLILGVAICVLSLLPVFVTVFLVQREYFILVGTGMMMIFIGVGVFFFVFTGNTWGAFENLLNHGQTLEDMKEARKKARQKTKIVRLMDDIYWPAIVVIYFLWSFLDGGWGWSYSWIIFVIGGIIYSGVLMIFDIDE